LLFYPSVSLPAQWFKQYRALANSIVVAGSGLGGLVLSPYTRMLFDNYGTAGGLRVISVLLFVLCLAAALLARERSGNSITVHGTDQVRSISRGLQLAVGDAKFSALAVHMLLTTMAFITPFYFLPSYMTAAAAPASTAALVLGVMSGVNGLSRMCVGLLADAMGKARALFTLSMLAAVSCFLVWPFVSGTGGGIFLFAIAYGFFGGAYCGLQSAVVAEVVDVDNLTNALGLLYALSALGYLLGPEIFAAIVGASGTAASYLGGQMFVAVLTMCGSLAIVVVLVRMHQDKNVGKALGA